MLCYLLLELGDARFAAVVCGKSRLPIAVPPVLTCKQSGGFRHMVKFITTGTSTDAVNRVQVR